MIGKAAIDVINFIVPIVAVAVVIGCVVFILSVDQGIHQKCDLEGGVYVSGHCLVGVKSVNLSGM